MALSSCKVCPKCGDVNMEFASKCKCGYSFIAPYTPPVPKCPTCGSTHIKEISTSKRMLGIFTVGLASSTLGKTRECKDCGYKW